MPRPTPGDRSGHLGTAVPKRDSVAHRPEPLEPAADLADCLSRIAGADLFDLEATDAQIEGWNAMIGTAAHDGFEHRLLVGIAIQQQRPGHGGKRQNDAAIGSSSRQSPISGNVGRGPTSVEPQVWTATGVFGGEGVVPYSKSRSCTMPSLVTKYS